MSESNPSDEATESGPSNFIRRIIDGDLESGKHTTVQTRFPPEPNGYLHIGHAKSICLNFGLASDYQGQCNLRFDDTNPSKEEQEFVDSIQHDIAWLGFDWGEKPFFASNYFETLYAYAVHLIKEGKAYVCDLSAEQTRAYRGTLTEPGRDSPNRDRSVDENLDLFARMKAGEFEDGSRVLRAKIDMASPNINLRDPTLYRIRHVHHHRTGDEWCVYPMYDYTHCISDALEGITHSICTLEFEDNRPLYDWVLDQVPAPCHPQQIEFARLALNYTVLSKRRLRLLVEENHVEGWDDPRMPTLAGIRRRGYPAVAIRNFCDRIGVAKANSQVDISMLEHALREELNQSADRVMVVLDPLKLVITNYPKGQVEDIEAVNNPGDEAAGTRMVPFSRELWIERGDFMEEPVKKWFRFAPGKEVRLKHAYYVTCDEVVKDADGNVVELRCTYDPESRGGGTPDGRKVRGTSHWVSAAHADDIEVRLYDRLFAHPNVGEGVDDFLEHLNPNSLEVLSGCKAEPGLVSRPVGDVVQFMRQGYFCVDKTSTPVKPTFNRTIALRDSWAKLQKKQKK